MEINEIPTERKDWVELERDVTVRVKNDFMLIHQRLKILQLCKDKIAEFPEEIAEAPEAKEAVEEIDKMAEENKND